MITNKLKLRKKRNNKNFLINSNYLAANNANQNNSSQKYFMKKTNSKHS